MDEDFFVGDKENSMHSEIVEHGLSMRIYGTLKNSKRQSSK